MDLGYWLRELGLEQYEAAFRENAVDDAVLPSLTAEDLKDLGVVLVGHRRKLLDAIAIRRTDAGAKGAAAEAPRIIERPPAARSDSGERRQVTVIFSDLVGSTALSASMDPEDLREVISAYQKCVAEVVHQCDGFIAKCMGDGVLVYFGYPQAHEDDAERAVRAGLELVAAVARLETRALLQTRIGIATGLVVVGDLIGSGEAHERGIIGETPNLAARLQAIAEPNTVVIADDTRSLLGSLFELRDLGPAELKGIAVIAGMFYLLDDAFRVGEYIQAGRYKGTVEGFSIRSIKLRHHRGPVFTVPFSLLGAVENMSRDWVIDKIAVGVTYDSDLVLARKLVKQIGLDLAKDPEFTPLILEPLKMQGVEQLGDFAVQIRAKMMTLPGEQFVIRRQAYAMIKKAFDENGIKFAFPTVQVAGDGEAAAAAARRVLEMSQPAAAE